MPFALRSEYNNQSAKRELCCTATMLLFMGLTPPCFYCLVHLELIIANAPLSISLRIGRDGARCGECAFNRPYQFGQNERLLKHHRASMERPVVQGMTGDEYVRDKSGAGYLLDG